MGHRTYTLPAGIGRWLARWRRAKQPSGPDTQMHPNGLPVPPELLLQISNYLEFADKVAFLKSCRACYQALAPVVFCNVIFSPTTSFSKLMGVVDYIARHPDYAAYIQRLDIAWKIPAGSKLIYLYQHVRINGISSRAFSNLKSIRTLSLPESMLLGMPDDTCSALRGRVQFLCLSPIRGIPEWFAACRGVVFEEDKTLWGFESPFLHKLKSLSPEAIAHGCLHNFSDDHSEKQCLEHLLNTHGNTIVGLVLHEHLQIWKTDVRPICENLETIEIQILRSSEHNELTALATILNLSNWKVPRLTTLIFSTTGPSLWELSVDFAMQVLNIVKLTLPDVTRVIDPSRYLWEKGNGTWSRTVTTGDCSTWYIPRDL